MTENIPQTSASERLEKAREALAAYDANPRGRARENAMHDCIEMLRELVKGPTITTSADKAVDDLLDRCNPNGEDVGPGELAYAVSEAFDAGIQYAHERWEPADVPSQEFMLRHLGLDYEDARDDEGEDALRIRTQFLAKEG